jgi:hypothetical protein
VATRRRPDVDLVDQQVEQGPVEHVAEVAGLGLGDRLLEQGDALVVAVGRVGQGAALVDQGRRPHHGTADGVGHGQRLVGPFDRLLGSLSM